MKIFTLKIDEQALSLKRLDKIMTAAASDYSRARIQSLIQGGHVTVNGLKEQSISAKVTLGDVVKMEEPEPVDPTPQPEEIALNIVYEDDHMLVINKQAGLVVHPGAGNHSGTLVNALLHHCKDSLSGIGGVLRPGIVHRLDKDTSGLMVVAKSDKAHKGLANQLQDRSLSRQYSALVLRVPVPIKGVYVGAIGRDPRNRLKMAMQVRGGKPAKTLYHVQETFHDALSQVNCTLESGRTHQIRVHMSAHGHPLIGDPLYKAPENAVRAALRKAGYSDEIAQACLSFPRQALHARRIAFIHPITGEEHAYEADIPEDYQNLLKILRGG